MQSVTTRQAIQAASAANSLLENITTRNEHRNEHALPLANDDNRSQANSLGQDTTALGFRFGLNSTGHSVVLPFVRRHLLFSRLLRLGRQTRIQPSLRRSVFQRSNLDCAAQFFAFPHDANHAARIVDCDWPHPPATQPMAYLFLKRLHVSFNRRRADTQ